MCISKAYPECIQTQSRLQPMYLYGRYNLSEAVAVVVTLRDGTYDQLLDCQRRHTQGNRQLPGTARHLCFLYLPGTDLKRRIHALDWTQVVQLRMFLCYLRLGEDAIVGADVTVAAVSGLHAELWAGSELSAVVAACLLARLVPALYAPPLPPSPPPRLTKAPCRLLRLAPLNMFMHNTDAMQTAI